MLLIAWTGAAVSAIGVVVFRLLRSSRPSECWVADAFLVVAGWLPILPMLLLAPHASETYLYLTVGLMTILLVSLMHDFYHAVFVPGSLLLVCGVCVTLVFGSATWERNRRVAACGATAHKILSAIPFGDLRDGAVLGFVDAAGDQIAKPYGYYRFDGLNTVGKDARDMQCAAQLVSGNDKIRAQMLDREELDRVESQHQPPSYDVLIVVGTDGNVTERKTAVP
jgi:hypothetical protein